MTAVKPLASLSLDLDDLWTYLRTRGDPAWKSRPSYLEQFVPSMLDLLGRLELTITFFVVGEDVTRSGNRSLITAIAGRGHEIANHSLSHESWLHLRARREIETEIAQAEDLLAEATGKRPTGFRGPGYSCSPVLLQILAERGYLYDASTLPTFLGPFARRYFLKGSTLSGAELERRSGLFGGFREGLRPLRPYGWQLPSGQTLVEVPVTTMPLTRLPFHMSYLLYLGGRSRALMLGYLHAALGLCRLRGVSPSFLLHPLDFLGPEQASGLAFFPGMNLPGSVKRDLASEVLETLAARYTLVPVARHAQAVLNHHATSLVLREVARA